MVVYGFETYTALDHLPLPLHEPVNMDVTKRVEYMKKQELRSNSKCNVKLNSPTSTRNPWCSKKETSCGYIRKDRFPQERNSELKPRGDGPFKVLKKINDNAYVIDIPIDKYLVSNTFNVSDLSPYQGDEVIPETRTSHFQGGRGR